MNFTYVTTPWLTSLKQCFISGERHNRFGTKGLYECNWVNQIWDEIEELLEKREETFAILKNYNNLDDWEIFGKKPQ
jgi:hypothetical protein